MLKVSDLRIDLAYQRGPEAAWVEAHRPFDPEKAGAIKVSARANGLWIIDGGGRWSIARADGIKLIAAVVIKDKTQKDEATNFVESQQDTRRLTSYHLWRADLVRRDPATMRIQTVLHTLKFKAGPRHSRGPDTISALEALRYVERHFGIGVLEDTLRLIRERWLTLDSATTGQMIKGLASFLATAGKKANYDEDRLVEVMMRNAPLVVMQMAQGLAVKEMVGGTQTRHIVVALVQKYNMRLSTSKKLDVRDKRR